MRKWGTRIDLSFFYFARISISWPKCMGFLFPCFLDLYVFFLSIFPCNSKYLFKILIFFFFQSEKCAIFQVCLHQPQTKRHSQTHTADDSLDSSILFSLLLQITTELRFCFRQCDFRCCIFFVRFFRFVWFSCLLLLQWFWRVARTVRRWDKSDQLFFPVMLSTFNTTNALDSLRFLPEDLHTAIVLRKRSFRYSLDVITMTNPEYLPFSSLEPNDLFTPRNWHTHTHAQAHPFNRKYSVCLRALIGLEHQQQHKLEQISFKWHDNTTCIAIGTGESTMLACEQFNAKTNVNVNQIFVDSKILKSTQMRNLHQFSIDYWFLSNSCVFLRDFRFILKKNVIFME